MASIQQSSVVSAVGYQSLPLRTGYESVIGTRVSKNFAFSASQKGKVTKKTDKVLSVVYEDESKDGMSLGVVHGNSAGDIIPHEIVSDLNVGDVFEEGDILAWNKGFFERDLFSPKNVVMKTGVKSTVALMEGNDTHEDGTAIGKNLSQKLTTHITQRRTILIPFDKIVDSVVEVGSQTEYDTILCTVKEPVAEGIKLDEVATAALASINNVSPKAKFTGNVSRIEMVYMGDDDAMSSTIAELVKKDNNRRAALRRDTGDKTAAPTGKIKESTFFGGEKVVNNTVAISFYIDGALASGVSDKNTIGNQLKSVAGRVMTGRNETEDGREIDVLMSYNAINARIVGSPIIQGTTNAVMTKLSQLMVEAYRS